MKNYVEFVNENINNWTEGFRNTKIFKYSGGLGDEYLQGCRSCDEIVPLKNLFQQRQLLGNVYQSLCNCEKCGKPIVFDEYKLEQLERFLSRKEETTKIV